MAHLTSVPNERPEDDTGQADETPKAEDQAQPKARRTGHPLPSDRISFARQLDILRGFAVAAADNNGAASSAAVAPLIGMSHNTINIATPFFSHSGLLSRTDRGRFVPSEAVVEFSRATQWDRNTAAHRLAPVIRRSWFGQIITRMVSVQRRSIQDVLTDLSGAANAGPAERAQLELLIEYAVAAGLVARDGGFLMEAIPAAVEQEARPAAAPSEAASPQPPSPGVTTAFRRDETENVVSFDISVRVRMSEFAGWRPERISAFFGGIAQVLAAKGRMEEDAGGS